MASLSERVATHASALLDKIAYVGINTASRQLKKHQIGTQVGKMTTPVSGGTVGTARGFKPGKLEQATETPITAK